MHPSIHQKNALLLYWEKAIKFILEKYSIHFFKLIFLLVSFLGRHGKKKFCRRKSWQPCVKIFFSKRERSRHKRRIVQSQDPFHTLARLSLAYAFDLNSVWFLIYPHTRSKYAHHPHLLKLHIIPQLQVVRKAMASVRYIIQLRD